jgi:hypothetical protein
VVEVCDREGIQRWPTSKAAAKAVQNVWDKHTSSDWGHRAFMVGVAAWEERLTMPSPEQDEQDEERADLVAEVGPLYGDVPKVYCPECGKEFDNRAHLGSHRYRQHGVKGTSASAKKREHQREVAEEIVQDLFEVEERVSEDQAQNGRVVVTTDMLHLRVLKAMLSEHTNTDEAFALAAEIATLELRFR